MNKQLIFIDDSGDPGFKVGSSDNFVMAAVLFVSLDSAELIMHEIEEYRVSLGWEYNHEFKFTKNPKRVVANLLRQVSRHNFQVYAVYIKKSGFHKAHTMATRSSDREKLYNWMIKELLQEIPLGAAKITIDGRSSKQNMKNAKAYLKREIGNDHSRLKIKFDDSVTTNLLQLADLVAGSINRSLQPDKTDSKDYISIFKNKIAKIRKINFR